MKHAVVFMGFDTFRVEVIHLRALSTINRRSHDLGQPVSYISRMNPDRGCGIPHQSCISGGMLFFQLSSILLKRAKLVSRIASS